MTPRRSRPCCARWPTTWRPDPAGAGRRAATGAICRRSRGRRRVTQARPGPAAAIAPRRRWPARPRAACCRAARIRRRRCSTSRMNETPSPAAATVRPATPLFVSDSSTPGQPARHPGQLVQGLRGGEGGGPDLLADLLLDGGVQRELGEHLAERGDQGDHQRRPQPEEHRAQRRDHGGEREHAEHDEVRLPGLQRRPEAVPRNPPTPAAAIIAREREPCRSRRGSARSAAGTRGRRS